MPTVPRLCLLVTCVYANHQTASVGMSVIANYAYRIKNVPYIALHSYVLKTTQASFFSYVSISLGRKKYREKLERSRKIYTAREQRLRGTNLLIMVLTSTRETQAGPTVTSPPDCYHHYPCSQVARSNESDSTFASSPRILVSSTLGTSRGSTCTLNDALTD